MIKVRQMYLKMIKTGLKLLLWPLFSLKYIVVNKMIAAVHHLVYMLIFADYIYSLHHSVVQAL